MSNAEASGKAQTFTSWPDVSLISTPGRGDLLQDISDLSTRCQVPLTTDPGSLGWHHVALCRTSALEREPHLHCPQRQQTFSKYWFNPFNSSPFPGSHPTGRFALDLLQGRALMPSQTTPPHNSLPAGVWVEL